MNTTLADSGFVELDRRFMRVQEDSPDESAADDSYSRLKWWMYGSTLHWDELLKHPRVVVLGEAGSGKTSEFQQQVRKLTSGGGFAFFVRLDEIVHDSLETIMGRIDSERFARWRDGFEDAAFFLDSVDESKIGRPSDFHAALRRFRDAMPPDFVPRTRIFLSARISEWHPATDGPEANRHLGLPSVNLYGSGDDLVSLVTVHLAPLEWPEVSTLLAAKGLNEIREFGAALARAAADEFIRRPIDALALFEFWRNNRRFGSLTELIESELHRKLQERASRAHDPLSAADSRAGAEALAAATVFCGRAAFKVRDDNMVTAALDGRACVSSGWTDDQYAALLARSIFDCASRGCVRFHHRRVREYLAASWVAARMRDGCPIDKLEELCFESIGTAKIMRRSLAPIAAWLASGNETWNDHMRRWILNSAPGVHFQFGDPGGLPPEYKRRVLRALVESPATEKALEFDSDMDAVRRFVDPTMEADIENVIRDRSVPAHLRVEMMGIASMGNFRTCAPTSFESVSSESEPVGVRVAAVKLIASLDDLTMLSRLREIAIALPRLPEQLTAAFFDSLAKGQIDVIGGCELLSKTEPAAEPSSARRLALSFSLRHKLPAHWHLPLLRYVLRRCLSEQQTQSLPGQPTSSDRLSWMRVLIPDLLLAVLDEKPLGEEGVVDFVAAMRFMKAAKFDFSHDWQEIQKATEGHFTLRRELFWDFVDLEQNEGVEGLARVWRMLPASLGTEEPAIADLMQSAKQVVTMLGRPNEHSPPFEFMAEDLVWLKEGRPNSSALDGMLTKSLGKELKQRLEANASCKRVRNSFLQKERFRAVRHLRRRQGLQYLSARNARARLTQWAAGVIEAIDANCFLYWNLWCVTLRTQCGQTSKLGLELPGQGALWDRIVQKLSKIYWDRVSSRLLPARTAAARHWRRFTPPMPRTKKARSAPSIPAMIANAGIQAAFDEGLIEPVSLSTDDIGLATSCAVSSPLWDFPAWFVWLYGYRASDIDGSLAECVKLEWEWNEESSDILEKLKNFEIGPKTQSAIIAKLSEPACRCKDSSTWAVDIILKQKTPPPKTLVDLARDRTGALAEVPSFRGFWLAMWLKIDADDALDAWEERLRHEVNADILAGVACGLLGRQIRYNVSDKSGMWSASQIWRIGQFVCRHIDELANTNTTSTGTDKRSENGVELSDVLEFRAALLEMLAQDTTKAATEALESFAAEPTLAGSKISIPRLRNEQLSRRADSLRWRPQDIRDFELTHETNPCDDYALFRIGLNRLSDIKNDVERSDTGLRTQLRGGDDERHLRIWLGNELTRRARQRYVVPQEGVIDQEQRPDLRLEHPKTEPVCIEIKWAQAWSRAKLMEGLELQLIGKYLRAHKSRCGIYVLAMAGSRRWRTEDGTHEMDFDELIAVLTVKAQDLIDKDDSLAKRIAVIGIDFRQTLEHLSC
jgi:hypothetical protein